jgi:hypothetical protein
MVTNIKREIIYVLVSSTNMDLNRRLGVALAFLIICVGIGACSTEQAPAQLMYIQGGSSTLSDGSNGTMTLTMNDVIPYSVFEGANRILLMPMEKMSHITLPLDAALVLNGEEGESVYLIKTESWSFDAEKMNLTLGIKPLEFYESEGLKKFTEAKQNLSEEKVGKDHNTSMYFEISGTIPSNEDY